MSRPHGEPLLTVRGLSFGYLPDQPVLTGVDLTVRSGQRIAVLGPNGGGKTTLFRLLVGALAARAGQISVQGTPLRRDRRGLLALRQRVQLVLQDPDDQLFSASVQQDVSFGPVNLGLSEDEVLARVAWALAALDITHLADRPTHLLSFGQRKRVAIAGAVAMRPRLLILDEPSAGLDPRGVVALLDTLSGLHAGGTTLMLATHDVDLAFQWADEVAVVADGAVLVRSAAAALSDSELLARAGLTPAWAPLVHRIVDRCPGLAGARPVTAGQLARLLAGTDAGSAGGGSAGGSPAGGGADAGSAGGSPTGGGGVDAGAAGASAAIPVAERAAGGPTRRPPAAPAAGG